MARKQTKNRKDNLVKLVGRIIPWLLVAALVYIAFFHIKIEDENNVTTIQGEVSNISTLAPSGKGGAFVTFQLNGQDYYYQMVDGLDRMTVKEELLIEENTGTPIEISVIDEPLWFNALYLVGKDRAVSIEGEGIHLPLSLHNHHQLILRVATLVAAVLVAILTHLGKVIMFFIELDLKRDQKQRKL